MHEGSTGDTTGETDLSLDSNPIREDRVKEARKKRQRGEYNNEEVYKKIAERLMDLFGIR
ncbi:MAG: hypothetical protein WCE90_05715 [Candidatus Zixiibacteriota bacterium]